jgi:hypothetical protein
MPPEYKSALFQGSNWRAAWRALTKPPRHRRPHFSFGGDAAFTLEVIHETESEMAALMMFARYEIGFLLAALIAVVAYQILTGKINTRGLLSEKTKNGLGGASPARVQLLLITLAFAFYLLSAIMNSRQFPTIDTKWLLILGGSHSIYLGGKGLSLFRSQLK